uniref:Uncharacterized protein n=1 Tax=Poecilia latipinna TaxID=48699 RepID=A0A3B3U325_9TELE
MSSHLKPFFSNVSDYVKILKADSSHQLSCSAPEEAQGDRGPRE